jgi:hypothetical protein
MYLRPEKMSVQDFTLNAATCTRYVDCWERARMEQHIQTIYDKEYGPSQVNHRHQSNYT